MAEHHALKRFLLALAAVSALLGATGCVRRGVILHGDWSLELNRVPWRTGCEGGTCYEKTGCENCRSGGASSGSTAEAISPPALLETAMPRFHPVPTQPVFSPRTFVAPAVSPLHEEQPREAAEHLFRPGQENEDAGEAETNSPQPPVPSHDWKPSAVRRRKATESLDRFQARSKSGNSLVFLRRGE